VRSRTARAIQRNPVSKKKKKEKKRPRLTEWVENRMHHSSAHKNIPQQQRYM
jgi:hypothetical protein